MIDNTGPEADHRPASQGKVTWAFTTLTVTMTALVFGFSGWLMVTEHYNYLTAVGMALIVPVAVLLIVSARADQLRALLARLAGVGQR